MATVFTEGDRHDHESCGRWPEGKKNDNSPGAPFGLVGLCQRFSPEKLGDVVRETNCLHAALVEMKTQGAGDFWMILTRICK